MNTVYWVIWYLCLCFVPFCIMFTPARDFLLETPCRIIIPNPTVKSFPYLILITKKGVNLSSCVLAKPKQLLSIIICLFKRAISYQTRRSNCSSRVLGVLRQACCKHVGLNFVSAWLLVVYHLRMGYLTSLGFVVVVAFMNVFPPSLTGLWDATNLLKYVQHLLRYSCA
jgi:hypothetical protein